MAAAAEAALYLHLSRIIVSPPCPKRRDSFVVQLNRRRTRCDCTEQTQAMNYPYSDFFIDAQRAKTGFAKSWEDCGKPIKGSLKRCDRAQSDMSPFSFILALLLTGTVAAARSEDPAFWLLVGPAPLAAVFTATAIFRRRLGRPVPSPDSDLLKEAGLSDVGPCSDSSPNPCFTSKEP
jgi:hypothetical protein